MCFAVKITVSVRRKAKNFKEGDLFFDPNSYSTSHTTEVEAGHIFTTHYSMFGYVWVVGLLLTGPHGVIAAGLLLTRDRGDTAPSHHGDQAPPHWGDQAAPHQGNQALPS